MYIMLTHTGHREKVLCLRIILSSTEEAQIKCLDSTLPARVLRWQPHPPLTPSPRHSAQNQQAARTSTPRQRADLTHMSPLLISRVLLPMWALSTSSTEMGTVVPPVHQLKLSELSKKITRHPNTRSRKQLVPGRSTRTERFHLLWTDQTIYGSHSLYLNFTWCHHSFIYLFVVFIFLYIIYVCEKRWCNFFVCIILMFGVCSNHPIKGYNNYIYYQVIFKPLYFSLALFLPFCQLLSITLCIRSVYCLCSIFLNLVALFYFF